MTRKVKNACVILLFCFIGCTLLFTVKGLDLWRDMVIVPEPEQCALCGDSGPTGEYPCLVNLSTGDVGEISVYDIDPGHLENKAQFKETGVYTYGFWAAEHFVSNTTDAEKSVSDVVISDNGSHIDPGHFCLRCRAEIAQAAPNEHIFLDGYILADISDRDNIRAYAVADGAEYHIRGCIVTVSKGLKDTAVRVTKYFDIKRREALRPSRL